MGGEKRVLITQIKVTVTSPMVPRRQAAKIPPDPYTREVKNEAPIVGLMACENCALFICLRTSDVLPAPGIEAEEATI